MKKDSITETISKMKPVSDADGEIRTLTEADFKHAVTAKQIEDIKKQTTIRLKTSTIIYFQGIANETGIPYQTLINMYLEDCVRNQRMPDLSWK